MARIPRIKEGQAFPHAKVAKDAKDEKAFAAFASFA
jgi:hypothetical protein